MTCSIALHTLYPALINALMAMSDCTPRTHQALMMKMMVQDFGVETSAAFYGKRYGIIKAIEIAGECE